MLKLLIKNILLFSLFTTYGQEQSRVLIGIENDINPEYIIYKAPKIISLVNCNYQKSPSVELLMQNILCADSQEKVNQYTLGGSKNAEQKTEAEFLEIKKRNKDKTYLQLISRLDLRVQGQQFAILKFKIFMEQAPNGISGAYQLQKVGDIWYKTVRSDLSELALMMIFIKPKIMDELMNNQTSKEPYINELLKLTKERDYLNFNKLYTEFSKWQTDEKRKTFFLEPTGW